MNIAAIKKPTLTSTDMASVVKDLCETGAVFWQRGWSLGGGGNYSVVLSRTPLEMVITASTRDKGRLTPTDFALVDNTGRLLNSDQPTASAEVLLHSVLAEERPVGAILHTHSVWGTILSDFYFDAGGFEISGFDLLKGLDGVTTHQASVWIEIFENSQDIPVLAEKIRAKLRNAPLPLQFGYLIRRHGLYTWGRDLAEARRHVEILEFLFECLARQLMLKAG